MTDTNQCITGEWLIENGWSLDPRSSTRDGWQHKDITDDINQIADESHPRSNDVRVTVMLIPRVISGNSAWSVFLESTGDWKPRQSIFVRTIQDKFDLITLWEGLTGQAWKSPANRQQHTDSTSRSCVGIGKCRLRHQRVPSGVKSARLDWLNSEA